MTILETRELKKIYGKGNAAVHALDGISLTVEKGEFVAIVGTSGSGKSTLLHMMGVLGIEPLLNRLPGTLSGGQQQRVAIARAILTKPAVLLADEPTGNLDSRTSQDVLGLLKETQEQFHQTVVMITHNEEIAQLSDRILHLEDGRIVSGQTAGGERYGKG